MNYNFTSMIKRLKDNIGLLILIACSGFILAMALLSEVSDGGADAIVHHRMAKFAFNHRGLFFDLWGKPAFTILSSPFAYFGFTAHKIFNVIIAAITLLVTWKTAKLFWILAFCKTLE